MQGAIIVGSALAAVVLHADSCRRDRRCGLSNGDFTAILAYAVGGFAVMLLINL